ncbi:MAG: type II toxin-antitoxin system HicB family antitoxin [Alphaproteobacteria bacterium]|nr:type II toxin-antitoxin system HicB family antitoxin [Alphaproteobacteria bacterium]
MRRLTFRTNIIAPWLARREREDGVAEHKNPPPERISFSVGVPVDVFQEDGTYIAVCKPLDLASQGDTPEEARANCREALMLFITSCYARGTLDQVLLEAGFMPESETEDSSVGAEAGEMIDIPISLVAHAQASAA